ncbi:unnamed protein product [Clonostachys byssicola]|uniref:Uncharacterized protein n=1 Tax=Clonostachys byssicola TaxID=160290 RepID=A0A9N9UIP5_9HYPO|nr:unnamed protein product [Clonostachys byssicola]
MAGRPATAAEPDQITVEPKQKNENRKGYKDKRNEVENKYAGLFGKLLGVGADNNSLRNEVRKLNEDEVKVLSTESKTKLWNFGTYHDTPHVKPWIKMEED